ncbi:unnamed protein product, partial [Polarella glacialis]
AKKALRESLKSAELLIDQKRAEVLSAEQRSVEWRDQLDVEWCRANAQKDALTLERETLGRLRATLEARDAALEEEREELARLREQQQRRGSVGAGAGPVGSRAVSASAPARAAPAASSSSSWFRYACGGSDLGTSGPGSQSWWLWDACSCPGAKDSGARRVVEEATASRIVPETLPSFRRATQDQLASFDPGPVRAPRALPDSPNGRSSGAQKPAQRYVDPTQPPTYQPRPAQGSGHGGA